MTLLKFASTDGENEISVDYDIGQFERIPQKPSGLRGGRIVNRYPIRDSKHEPPPEALCRAVGKPERQIG